MRFTGIKGKVWKAMSEYIRERDGYKCSTCHRTREQGFVMNAGHYLNMGKVGSNNTLGWDEMNCHCQCAYCNSVGQGEQERMGEYIKKKYGKKVLEGLRAREYKVDKVMDWQKLLDYYKNAIIKLRNEKEIS